MGRVNSAVIKTSEGVIFTLLPAGPVVRFVAWAIDLACVFVILIPLSAAVRFVSLLNARHGTGFGNRLLFCCVCWLRNGERMAVQGADSGKTSPLDPRHG